MWITSKRPTKLDSFPCSIDPIIISSSEISDEVLACVLAPCSGKICMFKNHAAEILTILAADGLTEETAGPVAYVHGEEWRVHCP